MESLASRTPSAALQLRCAQNDRRRLMQTLSTDSRITRAFPPDAQYLIGVSGGRDSVALLHWLISFGYDRLIVCHLNHRLRGRSSDADARFVKKLAENFDADFELGATDVRTLAKKSRMSIETAAREARY